jgi:hypothetical protein
MRDARFQGGRVSDSEKFVVVRRPLGGVLKAHRQEFLCHAGRNPASQRSLIVSSGGHAESLFSIRCVRFRSSECVESNRLEVGTK